LNPRTTFCETNPSQPCGKCITTVYNPNNPTFATQGAVDGSTYVDRQTYNAVTANNASLDKTFYLKLGYSPDPVFTIKNNINKCNNENVYIY
jgi:hypothetical protein